MPARSVQYVGVLAIWCAVRDLWLSWRADSMVAANKYLLREVRRLAIKDELLAMRLRGRLVVPLVATQPAK